MRILYHHRTYARDGQEVHVRAILRALREEGHAVQEVALVPKGQGSHPRPGGSLGRTKQALLRGALSLPVPLREMAEYAYTPVGAAMLATTQRSFRADFLYERYAFGNAAGALAARRLRLPLVLEVNSPLVQELTATRGVAFGALARRVERFILGSARLVCVVSQQLADILARAGADRDRLLVLPNGVHLDSYRPYPGDDERRRLRESLALPRDSPDGAPPLLVGFVGYFRRWHRIDLLLRAAALADGSDPQVVLVGEGEGLVSLRRLADELGLGERVHFLGSRDADEIPDLLAALDVAVLPSITPYASPLKLIEYMAAGLAIVAPDQPNIRELLGDGRDALLVPPEDPAAIAAALDRLADDPTLRRRLAAAARRTVEERGLTWRANACRVVDAVAAAAASGR